MEQDKRFVMATLNIDNGEEVSILDTEEGNAQLFCCECQEEELIFCKQEVDQVISMLNFQDELIKELLEKTEKQRETIDELETRLLEGIY